MKKALICFILFCLIACSTYAQNGRVKKTFNENEHFHKEDVENGEKIDFDHKDWRVLNLPHDWSVEGPFSNKWASGSGYLPAGIGRYRKVCEISSELKSRHVSLYFDVSSHTLATAGMPYTLEGVVDKNLFDGKKRDLHT